ncbi:MAG: alpha-isopropylmalate synthase regulatory domain-containing protein [Microthrixaceae bacterium]
MCSRRRTPHWSCSCAARLGGNRSTSRSRPTACRAITAREVSPTAGVDLSTEATIKVWVGEDRIAAVGEGNGPVNALDEALRNALNGRWPALERIHLTDFRVRVLDGPTGPGAADTAAVVRVLAEHSNGSHTWTTIGCHRT